MWPPWLQRVQHCPPHVKSELVVGKISELMETGQHQEMMAIISPWEPGEFDFLNPRLGRLGDSMENKTSIFQKLIFKDIIIPKIRQGAQAAQGLLTFAELCLTYFSDVDMLELDDVAAAALNSALDVWVPGGDPHHHPGHSLPGPQLLKEAGSYQVQI